MSVYTRTYFSSAQPLLISFGPKALARPQFNLPDRREPLVAVNRNTDQSSLLANSSSTGELRVPYQHLLLRVHSSTKLQSTPTRPAIRYSRLRDMGRWPAESHSTGRSRGTCQPGGHGRLRAVLRSPSGLRGVFPRGRGRAGQRSATAFAGRGATDGG